jgi:hypothetical protein
LPKPLHVVGYGFFGLIGLGLGLRAIMAASDGDPWMGESHRGLPIGTYIVLIGLTVALFVGLLAIVRWVKRRMSPPRE